MEKKFYLHENWKFTVQERTTPPSQEIITQDQWYNASVPGTVHTDLLKNELIADPFYSDNELALQWIGDLDWLYKTTFTIPGNFDLEKPIFIVFEGIDTIADIFLNGSSLGTTDNMFRSFKYDLSGKLNAGVNTIEVLFNSPVRYAKAKEAVHGKLPVALRSERVYIRKAQYSFGWDWGPCFITMGLWRPVFLWQPEEKINIERITFQTISADIETAFVRVRVRLNSKTKGKYKVRIMLEDDRFMYDKILEITDSDSTRLRIKVNQPRLWQPNGHGSQFLYKLTVQLFNDKDGLIDEKTKHPGIRTILLKTKEKGKQSFQFIVNGVPVFCKGACWIPADSFLPRAQEAKYRSLLQSAKDANMNMIRVWGGGIYEDDIFYDLCDEMGLMVWQDFMFACASYPETPELIENIKQEVNENVARLQVHPCIALWCGNNENEWIWYQEQKQSINKMPGFRIFSTIIATIVKRLDPQRPYRQSSPFGEDDDPNSELSGNRHQWDIWSRWIDYKNVVNDKSLFVTEFGFQAPANYDTFKNAIPKRERSPQSRIFEFHNKQVEGPERLYKFLSAHLPVASDLKDYIYLTQLNQGFALKQCLEHWRLRMPETNGTLIWQLNDCWPVSSWAMIDSEMRPKLSYYFVKQAFAPVITGLVRTDRNLDVIIFNSTDELTECQLHLQYVHLPKGKTETIEKKNISIPPFTKELMITLTLTEKVLSGESIIISSLLDKSRRLIHRNFYAAAEWKHMELPEALPTYEIKPGVVKISSDKPAFFVRLSSPGALFVQNGLIILPEEILSVPFSGDVDKKFEMNLLNNYLKK